MYHARFTPPAPPDIWIAFADGAARAPDLPGTPLQQSGTYAAVLASLGCDTALARVTSGGALIGQACIHLRCFGPLRLAWVPRGPVWTAETPAHLRASATIAMRRAAPFRALWASSAETPARGLVAAKGRDMAELDLRPDDAARRAAQHSKWRNRLRRAEEAGLDITARPLDLIRDAELLSVEEAQRRGRGYTALPSRFTQSWVRTAPGASLMLIASERDRPAAFMLMLLHGDVATYHIGWTGARGRALSAHNLLLWRASVILAARGYTRLDLGQIDLLRTPGLTRFKLGIGAARRALPPTVLHI